MTHEQNTICSKTNLVPRDFSVACSKTHLVGTTHEQSIICRQLFACHEAGLSANEKEGNDSSNNNCSYQQSHNSD